MDDEAQATETGAPSPDGGSERRWRLAIGADDETSAALSSDDKRLSAALDALYGDGANAAADPRKRRGGLGRSAPRVAQWMGDIRSFFPAQVVQIVQKDAFERLDLKQMLMEPEFLKAIEADVNLVADLVSLRSVMPAKTKDIARTIIADIVAKLMQRLEQKTAEAIRGALDRSRRTNRPRSRDIDWQRTISANLRHYQPEHKAIVPEKLVGFMHKQRRLVDLDEVVLCVDQSGSMASSVIYASIFAAVMASLPVVRTKLVCFDTAIVDLTEELSDPVEVLFGVQLGGGTDINQAVAYCAERIERPTKSHLVLITDLYEGGNGQELLRRLAALVRSGVNVVVLLALTDQGRPGYDPAMAGSVAALGIPVFACTPDLFPDMMAAALRREDIGAWAAGADVKLIRADAEAPSHSMPTPI
ncbi:VWA domain-containing protein [Mesorhizobium sp.]|uniref:VWA domain-containing protein n=1 Tax=Mesorhizobium sp. TaxID=1871066 RepID=UPI0012110F98|nr:VWA domain-containing protein [Mesorhizobium sp.]TIO08828.1 MAG: VWA domain-containing protein [Mesorhizobium sp.]TIO36367.1 MAG: VWA domain-containing protein [Mesorhizobium sp.]TIP11266.1 MAG: VWA domain-containing protein [Mesorhizobium sp.]